MKLLEIIPRLGVTLLLSGLVLTFWPTLPVFVVVAALGLLIGLAVLYAAVDNRDAVRISWILAASLLFAYDGGSVSTYLNASSPEDFAIMAKDRPIELISAALALANVICGLLLIAGRFEHPAVRAIGEAATDGWFSLALTFSGLALIAAAYLVGDLGYMGIQTDAAGRVSVLGAAANLIEGPLAGIAGYMVARGRRPVTRPFYAIVVILLALAVVPAGRRAIILILLVATLGFAFGGGLRRLTLPQKVIGVLAGGAFAYVMSSFFFALRLAGWELGNNAPLLDQLGLGAEFMFSPSLQERFTTLFYDNVRERTFVLGYLADLMEAVGKSAPLYGEALLYYVRLGIPSILDPAKDQILAYQMMESLVHPKLGLPVIDQANTILTDGMTDFGIAGAVLYAAAIVLVLRGSIWAIQKMSSPITVMFGIFAIIHMTLKPELTLDEYLVPLRNLAVLLPVLWVIETMTGSFSSPARHNLPFKAPKVR